MGQLSVIGCTVVAAARGAHYTLPPAVVGPALGGWCNVLGPPAREAALDSAASGRSEWDCREGRMRVGAAAGGLFASAVNEWPGGLRALLVAEAAACARRFFVPSLPWTRLSAGSYEASTGTQ